MMFKKETELIRICQLEKVTTRGKCKAYKEIKVLQRKKCREKNIQYFLKKQEKKTNEMTRQRC